MTRAAILFLVVAALALAGCESAAEYQARMASYDRERATREWAVCQQVCPAPLRPALLPAGNAGLIHCACLPPGVSAPGGSR